MAPNEDEARQIAAAAERDNVLVCVRPGCADRRTPPRSRRRWRPGRSVTWWPCSTSNRSAGGTSRTPTCAATGAASGTRSSLLMAKRRHDLDWLGHVIGSTPSRVASFGRLEPLPPGGPHRPAAGNRCTDCAVEPELLLLGACWLTRAGSASPGRTTGRWPCSPPTPTADTVARGPGGGARTGAASTTATTTSSTTRSSPWTTPTASPRPTTVTAFTPMAGPPDPDLRHRRQHRRRRLHGQDVIDFRTGRQPPSTPVVDPGGPARQRRVTSAADRALDRRASWRQYVTVIPHRILHLPQP